MLHAHDNEEIDEEPKAQDVEEESEDELAGAAANEDIVVERLVQKLRRNQQAPPGALFLKISEVPEDVGASRDRMYAPCHVSIGSSHRRRSELCRDAEKLSCLKYLLGGQIDRERLKPIVDKVRTIVTNHGIPEGRRQDNLVEMLLLDGCYVVNVIGTGPQRQAQAERTDERPLSLSNVTDRTVVMRDIWYLLENQIPFIVVKEIYMETCKGPVEKVYMEYARHLLKKDSYIAEEQPENGNGGIIPGTSEPVIDHLLHLIYTRFPKPREAGSSSNPDIGPWRRATEYVSYSNVRFMRRKLDGTSARSVLDVQIDGGKVQVPRLCVNSHTWTILLNLMALEQRQPSLGGHVTAYCLFMSEVACTVEDVKLLLRSDVIENHLGDPEKVATGFAKLCSEVIFDRDDVERNYLKPMWLQLEKRYASRVHNFFSWFRLTYWSCRNLPVLMAAVAGLILLASGVVSAVYAAITYYQPAPPSAPTPGAHN